MILLNKNTKKAKHFIKMYLAHSGSRKNEATSLYKLYKKFSEKKYKAFNNCVKLKSDLNGGYAYFCGYNCDKFNYAFLIYENGAKYLIYMTSQNTYKIDVSDVKEIGGAF